MDPAYNPSPMPATGEVYPIESQGSQSRGCLWTLVAVILILFLCCCCSILLTLTTVSAIFIPLFSIQY